jgi:AAA domain
MSIITPIRPGIEPAMEGEQRETLKAKEPRFKFETADEIFNLPDANYLIERYVPERCVGLLIGKWGARKTFLGFSWALHLSYGFKDWFGYKLPGEPTDCLIIAREGASGFKRRIQAFRDHHELDDNPKNLIFLRSPVSFADDASFTELKESIKRLDRPFKLSIADTVGRAIPGVDMAKEQHITLFMERLQQIGEVTQGASLGVHHENKSGDATGSMFFQNNSDFMFSVAKDGDDADLLGKITCLKMKDDEGQWSQKVEYTKILLANGKSSLVVSRVFDDDTKAVQSKEPDLTKDEATFYRILYDAGTAGLPVEQWNAAAKEAGLGVKRRSDLFDLRKSLQDKGRVREYAGKWRVNHYG